MTARNEGDRLLSVAEAAVYLSCSRQHLYDLIAAGKLRAIDIGIGRSQTRVRRAELEAFITKATSRRSTSA